MLEVVQAGRIVQHTPARARAAQGDRQGARSGRAAVRRLDHRDRGGGVPGARSRARARVRFNDTAGSMARDAVFNAASVIRAVDRHRSGRLRSARQRRRRREHRRAVGRAGVFPGAVQCARRSAAAAGRRGDRVRCRWPGNVRGVGGVVEKLYAARQAGDAGDRRSRARTRARSTRRPRGSRSIPVGTVVEALAALGLRVPLRPRSAPPARRRPGERRPVRLPVDRIPPNNLEAEMALLGSILVDKEMMAAVSEIVQPARLLRVAARDDLPRAVRALRARRAARQSRARRRAQESAGCSTRSAGSRTSTR